MYQMSMADMRHGVFKSIQGERWWRLIRGQHVELPPIVRGQVGHSNVLAPEFRTDRGAYGVACRMVEKCGERLRWESLSARRLYVEVRSYEGPTWRRSVKFTPSNVTRHFMAVLETIWQPGAVRTPSHVGVALQDVLPREDVTMDLFGDYRQQALDSTTDALNPALRARRRERGERASVEGVPGPRAHSVWKAHGVEVGARLDVTATYYRVHRTPLTIQL